MLFPNGTTTRPTVSSPFGPRTGGAFSFHYGADCVGYSTVRACGAGLVTFAGWMNDNAGNTVVIDYGGGVTEVHMHLKSFATSKGKRIAEGAAVGVMGATGNATGNCDHLEIRVNGKSVEPLAYIASRLTAGASSWNYTGRPTADIQRLVGATPDGVHGPETDAKIKTWQAGNRLIADGIWGDLSDAVGFPIKVDGDPGIRTFAKLQHRIGAKIDGQDGPDTTRHMQAALGVPVDGQRGPITVSAWQKAVGATVDGVEGPGTWSATQAFLNTGKPFPKVTAEPVGIPGRNATTRPLSEIQARLNVPQTGVWDRATSDAVGAFQQAQGIEPDRVWGQTSDGLAFPPAGSIHGVDYSFARPSPAMLASRGVKLAGRYLWREKYDDGSTNKGIGRAELDALHVAGIKVFFIYEEDGKELLGGFDAGVRVAKAAEGFRQALGIGAVPIYFNVDYDATAEQMVPTLAALDGIASVIGLERTGLYGGVRPITAAFNAGKITWGFQTYAWSGGVWDRRAQLQQWSNGQWGGTVDFTRAMVSDFGQHPVAIEEPEETIEVPRSKLQAFYDWLKGLLGGGA